MLDQWCATCALPVPIPEGDQEFYECATGHLNTFNVYGTLQRAERVQLPLEVKHIEIEVKVNEENGQMETLTQETPTKRKKD